MNKQIKIEITRNPYNIKIMYGKDIIKKMHFYHRESFIHMLHVLEDKNDKEIYDWSMGYCEFTDMGEE